VAQASACSVDNRVDAQPERSRLFVYGTLRRGFENRFARLLRSRSRFLGTGRIRAKLHQFSGYTGAIQSDDPDQWIPGELYELKHPSILSILDRYEGREFHRKVVQVELCTEHTLEAWVYFYRGNLL
jgi:gamma-glutamylcyclotransferase (GGCT)/AIG2-like uncharacterized protein YtfP